MSTISRHLRKASLSNDDARLQVAFERYHALNPGVYQMVDRYARRLITRGLKNASMVMIFEAIRFESLLDTGKPFKLPNNLRPYYARLWMKNNPQPWRFFKIGLLRSTRERARS